MKIRYLIRSLSSGKYYFDSTTSAGDYFIPDGEYATKFTSYEDAEYTIETFGFVGVFEIVTTYLKK